MKKDLKVRQVMMSPAKMGDGGGGGKSASIVTPGGGRDGGVKLGGPPVGACFVFWNEGTCAKAGCGYK